jgi:hypothetical protein
MNDNPSANPNPGPGNTADQLAAFQKIWMTSMAKVLEVASVSSNPPPPELLREVREAIFRTLAKSWDEFMRSPQFLESMKQMMEQAIGFRKMSNDFLGRARNEMQAPSLDDINSAMLSVRHIEKRLLDRMEELSAQMAQLAERLPGAPPKTPSPARPPRRKSPKPSAKKVAV